jgi:hypothetical protein
MLLASYSWKDSCFPSQICSFAKLEHLIQAMDVRKKGLLTIMSTEGRCELEEKAPTRR